MSATDRISFLAGTRACAGMSELELAAFDSFLVERSVASGEILFREGESGGEMFFLVAGAVATWTRDGDGTRREIYSFTPGSLFGEMAVVEGSVRSANAEARGDSRLLALSAIDFYRIVWLHPGLAVKLLSNMSHNLASWLDEAAGYLGDLARWGEGARRKAVLDEATGLFNRRFLDESLRARLARGVGPSAPCALLTFDIDRIHEVNWRLGDRGGDQAIAAIGSLVARRLSAREGKGIVAARLAGDEFSVFLPEAGKVPAMALAEELRSAIAASRVEFREGDKVETIMITASFGCAAAPQDGSTPEALAGAADRALLRAKEEGRNRVIPA